jgi:thioredoxin 1
MVLHLLPLVLAMSGQAPPPPQQAPPQQTTPATVVARAVQAPRKIYNETSDAKSQIATAIAAADESEIRVLINWGANDDERCTKFSQAQRAPEISGPRFFSDEYKVVYVDVGRADKNMDVAASYGAKPAPGALPYLTILDRSGKVLAGASSADMAGDDPAAFDPKKIATFLTTYQAPAPDADPPFQAALSQAKKDGRYVFLWFSAPW